MSTTISRRDFLRIAGASLGALAIGQLLPVKVAEAARLAGLIDVNGNGYIPTMCEMCVWRCGVLAKVEDGRVVKLEGNPDHPHSMGHLCARGQSGLMNTYDPDRVLTPLIRVGTARRGQIPRSKLGGSPRFGGEQYAGDQRSIWAGGDGFFLDA
ncbi:MAG: twin-arginine translocation signal domain-containing protein [Chloroflexota bacterium]